MHKLGFVLVLVTLTSVVPARAELNVLSLKAEELRSLALDPLS